MANHTETIRVLEEALASGLRTVTIEGTTHTYQSTEELRRSIAYFRSQDDASRKSGKARRRLNRIRLY